MIPSIELQGPVRGALRRLAAAHNDITNRVSMPSSFTMQRRLSICIYAVLGGFVLVSAAHAGTVTRTTSYEYEPATGLLAAQVQEPGNAQLNLRMEYTYGQFGNLLTTQVSSTATGLGAIPSHTSGSLQYDANGVVPVSTTNALGHVVKTAFTPSSLPRSHTDANGLTTTWQYDGLGRKTQEQRPDGTTTRWQYLLCGAGATCTGQAKYVMLMSQFAVDGTTENGPWVRTYLDRLDRTVRVETNGFSGVSIVDTEYDGQGRVARVSLPYFANATIQWTVYGYDVLGRLVSTTTPDNGVVTKSYNGLTATTTNALKQTQTWLVNSLGKVVKVTDAENNSLSYGYDALGNLTQTTDPKGNMVSMVYDALGRKTSMTDPDLGSLSYSYDVLGRLRQQTDAKSNVMTITYDLLGRTLNRVEADLVSTWTYDSCSMGKGRLCRATADNGYSTDYSFDAMGRQIQSTSKVDTDYASKVTYDANGRVATTVYPTGLTLKHIYTPAGYVKEIRNNASDALYWQANATDAEGRLLQQTFGNGVVGQQVFDAATGRTKNIYAGAGNAVQNLSFTYDQRGNMLTRNDANQNLAETFLYDALNRLTSNTVNSLDAGLVTQTYAYDSIGNITSRSDIGGYTYGAVNTRPHAVAEIALAGGGKREYTYDANGNLVKEEQRDSAGTLIPAKGRTGSYTSFDMPVTLANPAATLSFVYGPDHQRVKQIAPSGTTIYVHPDNAGALAYEKTIKADGSIEHKHYITAPGGVVALVTQTAAATKTLYLHRDHLGSTTAVTDEAGTVMERMAYEPFGKRRTPAGAGDPGNAIAGMAIDRGFTNHEHLDELGLIHMNGRVYDPAIARFMTADPSVPYPTNIQSYNRYSYVRNNPLILIDPSGFCDRGSGSGHKEQISWGNCETDRGDERETRQEEVIRVLGADGIMPNGGAIVHVPGRREAGSANTGTATPAPGTEGSEYTFTGGIRLGFWESAWIGTVSAWQQPVTTERVLDGMEALPVGKVAAGPMNFFGKIGQWLNACCCFPAGTPIVTEDGATPIEQIQVGQLVHARDEKSGLTALKPVTQLFITKGKSLFRLTTRSANGVTASLEVTDNHPFWVEGIGWTDSAKLRPGMVLKDLDKSELHVVGLKPLDRTETTYNFTVADFHTYFAGPQKAFVHNCTCAFKAGQTLFRGGQSLNARLGTDVVAGVDGLIHPLGKNGKPQGLSVNINALDKFIQQYGGAFPVRGVPDGLQVLQSGKAGHYVVSPAAPMKFEQYQGLLNQINLGTFNSIK